MAWVLVVGCATRLVSPASRYGAYRIRHLRLIGLLAFDFEESPRRPPAAPNWGRFSTGFLFLRWNHTDSAWLDRGQMRSGSRFRTSY
jgi:hypothetical protein